MIAEVIKVIFSYLTLWNGLLIIFFTNNMIPKYYGNSLLMLSTFVLIGGLYLHFIKPKYIILSYFSTKKKFNDKSLLLIDLIFHILPIIILNQYLKYNRIKLNNNLNLFMITIIIYNYFNSIENRYNINYIDCSIIYVISILIYINNIKYYNNI